MTHLRCFLLGCHPVEPYAVCERCGRVGCTRLNGEGRYGPPPREGLLPMLGRMLLRTLCRPPAKRARCWTCRRFLGRQRVEREWCSQKCYDEFLPF